MMLNLFKPKTKPFLEVLKLYFTSKHGLKDSTIEKHQAYYNNILKFFKVNKLNLQIHEVKIKHMELMRAWILENIQSCRKGKRCTLEHASRHIEHCQGAFDYAVMMEYYTFNPIDVIKCQRDKVGNPESLDVSEIRKLMKANFTSSLWQQSVDYLLFMCFTGLNYMDLWVYEIEQDKIMVEGEPRIIEWVTSPLGRGKNNKPYSAEFNEHAKNIRDKYSGNFPYRTNQALNRVLKKIALFLNIDKDLSTSIGRKTYSTLRYDQGMSIPGICDELGNTPGVLNKHYITASKNRLKAEIAKLKQPILPQENKQFAICTII